MSLPLHAAGIYNAGSQDYCSNYVVSSYTPTLTALLRAQKPQSSIHKHEAKLNLIAVMRAWDPKFPTLWNVKDEIQHIRTTALKTNVSFNDSCVDDGATTINVAESLSRPNIAHIACHGVQDADNALLSGFCLSDGNLTVSRLMDIDLKDAFFAFLSACETAKGDEKQPDQTVHLAAAMLFVGFQSVVANMW
jgi:CHAT domain-containing protein